MKKGFVFGFFAIFMIFVVGFVSALSPGQVGEQVKDFYVDFFGPILAALFGGWNLGGLFLFEKFLIFVMLVGLISVSLKKVDLMKENKSVTWIISIVIPLIAVRFLNIEQIDTIIFSYTWVAVVLTTVLPLLIFFFFIYNLGGDHPILRKTLWILFLAIYIGLYSSATDQIDSKVYAWTIGVIVVFIILDRKINNYFNLAKLKSSDKNWKYTAVAKLDQDIYLLENSSLPTNDIRKAVDEKKKQKKNILEDSY